MMELRETLLQKLEEMGESYYPLHEYPPSYEPQNIETRKEYVNQIIDAIIAALPDERELPDDSTLYIYHVRNGRNAVIRDIKRTLNSAKGIK